MERLAHKDTKACTPRTTILTSLQVSNGLPALVRSKWGATDLGAFTSYLKATSSNKVAQKMLPSQYAHGMFPSFAFPDCLGLYITGWFPHASFWICRPRFVHPRPPYIRSFCMDRWNEMIFSLFFGKV